MKILSLLLFIPLPGFLSLSPIRQVDCTMDKDKTQYMKYVFHNETGERHEYDKHKQKYVPAREWSIYKGESDRWRYESTLFNGIYREEMTHYAQRKYGDFSHYPKGSLVSELDLSSMKLKIYSDPKGGVPLYLAHTGTCKFVKPTLGK